MIEPELLPLKQDGLLACVTSIRPLFVFLQSTGNMPGGRHTGPSSSSSMSRNLRRRKFRQHRLDLFGQCPGRAGTSVKTHLPAFSVREKTALPFPTPESHPQK